MNLLRPILCATGVAFLLLQAACSGADPSQTDRSAAARPTATAPSDEVPSDQVPSDQVSEDAAAGSAAAAPNRPAAPESEMTSEPVPTSEPEIATLGAGCFWCIEAVLEQADGVLDVRSGYMGGHVDDPTYSQVCSGTTGHAEVVQVRFDPARISYEDLLAWFWKLHDPTTLNRQGADRGTQYRSAIFVHSPEQRRIAEASKAAEDASGRHADPIVTEITDASTFYEAEEDHQDFYRLNPNHGYCRMVIAPKLDKLKLEK